MKAFTITYKTKHTLSMKRNTLKEVITDSLVFLPRNVEIISIDEIDFDTTKEPFTLRELFLKELTALFKHHNITVSSHDHYDGEENHCGTSISFDGPDFTVNTEDLS